MKRLSHRLVDPMRAPGRAVRKLAGLVREIWSLVGIALVLVVLAEGALSLCVGLIEVPDYRIRADGYQGAPWARDYFTELREASHCDWKPYVYWRHKPFSGRYVNVDEKGIRYTATTGGNLAPTVPPYTIFMFGGSTLWGTGARDTQTIPSLVASGLHKEGIEVDVVNFGESGYVSTQEVIELLLQLQKGNIPQLVIFYDGINDTYSAYQQGIAGVPQNEFNRVSEFRPSVRTLLMRMIGELPTSKLARKTVTRLGRGRTPECPEPKDLAKEVVRIYRNNITVVESLSQSLGFKALFYWQPNIFGKNTLSDYETKEREKQQNAESFFQNVCQEIQRRCTEVGKDGITRDMSDVFREVSSPLYVDWCHLSEYGNSLVAQRMIEDILPLVHGTDRGTQSAWLPPGLVVPGRHVEEETRRGSVGALNPGSLRSGVLMNTRK